MTAAAKDAWTPPSQFEEYRIIRPLGQGGMGQVVLAEDRLLARLVAIKFIAAASPSAEVRERFFVEARAAARLSHPNVVAIYRVGEIQGRPFLVSEYVRGDNLAALDTPVPWRRALAIGIELTRGLAAAHRRGVLHRDIKPANAVLSEDGSVKLLDFGLAELLPEVYPSGAEAPSAQATPEAMATVTIRPATASAEALPITADLELRADPTHRGGEEPDAISATVELDPGGDPGSDAPRALPGGTAVISTTLPAIQRAAQPRIAGTPRYMAPEIWNSEPATARADVYALGVVLYELCAGAPPHGALPLASLIATVIAIDAPPLAKVAPGVDPRFAAIVDRCLRRDASLRFSDGDALREALEQLAAPDAAASAVPEGNPYRGLLAFEAEHRRLFFGRSAEILGIVDRLRADPFVLVTGDSGTGKSSLCRAGVLPAVAEDALGHPVKITTVSLGRRPLSALGAALAALLEEDEAAVTARLRVEPSAIARELKRRAGDVLLFVDQLEELCTLATPDEAAAAAEALHGLADRAGGLRVLATARSDFLTRLSALPGLGDDLLAALYLLRPLTAARLREVVTGPAAAKGFTFASEAIVEALVGEAQGAEAGLPLLQFALAELWDARDEAKREIPASALEAIGGVGGALARHADRVLARLPAPQREGARAILLALVTAEGTRRWRTEEELLVAARAAAPEAGSALAALVQGRLLVAREAQGGAGSAFTIAHEALLSGWDTLRGWLSQNVEGRALRQRLERAAAEWERLERAKDALWGERLLAEVTRINIDTAGLGAREAAFLAASRKAARRRRLRRAATVIGLPLAIGLAVLGGRVNAAHDLTVRVREAAVALGQARVAREALDALRKDAFARFDAGDMDQAEKVWAAALSQGAEVDRAYADVFGRLEVVLKQDGGRKDARSLLAEALYERAVLAEREGRAAERDELVRRLRVQEPGTTSRWDAPAHFSIETQPPGAEVGLARYVLQDGRWVSVPEASLGQTPVLERTITPGSVVLTFSAPGRAIVRLPVLLERGESRRIALDLPLEADVPEGFVYVPPGRFLYGSDNEVARRFYLSEPLHPVETDAYLIARNETTYGEWIAFLRSLPSSERPARLPQMQREGFTVALTEPSDGNYQLTLGQPGHLYVVRLGEPIRYKDRDRRQSQDWLRLPVMALSFDDARAYAAWLDRAGRIPGARPCSEREWERAARGADSRSFPGGERLSPDDANFNLTYGRRWAAYGPDEVGTHPASDSPFGVHDQAGNVWELTSSAEPPGTPVARSGGFFQGSVLARVDNRSPTVPANRNAFFGFRACATPRAR